MFRNYLLIAFRNLQKHKGFMLINTLGLSLGVACCLMLALYIQDEMSYDKHHAESENVYRIITEFEGERGLNRMATCSPPIALTIGDEIPEVVVAARLFTPPGVSQNLIKYEDKIFFENNGFLADSTIFNILGFSFVEGNPLNALVNPNTVVLSDRLSKKLFGTASALNKVIYIAQGGAAGDYRVTGVYRENKKSFEQPNFIISMASNGWGDFMRSASSQGEWGGQNFVPSYVRLVKGHDKAEVVRKMNDVLEKHGADDMKAIGMRKTLNLELVEDIYLRSDIGRSPRISYIYTVASIGVFILLLACINFMNLSTAKATKRSAEIGVRKVMGAFRTLIMSQLLAEAMFVVFFAVLVSLGMVQVGLPFFNELTGKAISLSSGNTTFITLALLVIMLGTGILSGSYPAFYLSSFKPAEVLKGKMKMSNASSLLRQGLVVFQFMIGIILTCGMLIVNKQVNFMENRDMGFDKSEKLVLPLRTEEAKKQYVALRDELQKHADIKTASGAEYVPGQPIWSDLMLFRSGQTVNDAVIHRLNPTDYNFADMLGIKLLAGRTFTADYENEVKKRVTILNRTSIEKLGFTPEEAIGQKLLFEWQGTTYTFEVVGVMENYHHNSLKEEIYPIAFVAGSPEQESFANLVISLNTTDIQQTLQKVESTWKKLLPETPFEFNFMDENIQRLYEEDRKVSAVIKSFTVIAMIISCLGLYGLSSYMAERRVKEIGVRKVLGASVSQLVSMMSREFIKLIAIAFILSVPIAWLAMNSWLEKFAYKIAMPLLIFVYAGVAALIVALVTVSFESFRAASSNPVNTLRSE